MDFGRSSRWLSTNQSVGNLSEIEAIQLSEHCVFPESSSATARSSGLISAHASPSTQLKHRKDGLPLRHQRPRRAARRRAHQQAVRTRFRRETPRILPDEARRDADASAPTRAEAPATRGRGGHETDARGRRGGCASEARAPRVCLAIRSVRRSPAPAEPSTDRARVHLPRCHGCAVFLRSRSTRASRSRAFLERSLTRPSLPPPTNSTSVMCSAAKPAFVEKVEKAGKAAIAGLAASAVLASVR